MATDQNEEALSGLFAPSLPATAYVRLDAIIGKPDKPGVIPISRSSFYAGIKSGRFRPPTKIGSRTSAWTVGYVRALLLELASK